MVNDVVASNIKDTEVGEPFEKKQKITTGSDNDDIKVEETAEKATPTAKTEKSPTKKSKKPKGHPYGLTPGVSPFPDWPHPTPEECRVVNDLLTQVHGPQIPPPTIPKPSLTVAGCGEVPSILDAMIRTRLSAATTGKNSSMAFQGLVDRFGILKEGIGQNSVNWDAVRRADSKDVMDAIKCGGLGKEKSKDIKAILDMVYEENQTRCQALLQAQSDVTAAPKGAENETPEQKNAEIIRAEENVLSLDHLHALEDNDAMLALVKYPGIGVKTASCVMLFCMRRASFAVDTHVFRLLKWLNWVPPDVKGEIAAFRHVEVKVPDEYKYSLHQLFLQHGKKCGRCKAATGDKSVDWDKGCIIDSLVTRTGKRKNAVPVRPAQDFFKKRSPKADDSMVEKPESGKKITVKKSGAKRTVKKNAMKKAEKEGKEPAENDKKNASDANGLNDENELSDPPNDEENSNAGDSNNDE